MTSVDYKNSLETLETSGSEKKNASAWLPVIGLEVHAQLATQSKLFSGAATAYGADPNTQACPIDLALPGVLPVLNAEAVNMAVKFGLSIEADIPSYSVFARKNYFYPDLPKGYQISQHEHPIVGNGQLTIELDNGEHKSIRITRAHLEEDAGKSLHEGLEDMSGIDLNRAGVPLLEIVSEPDLASPKEAVAYLKTLHTLVRYLEICDGNLQEGSFRCDANVSVRRENGPLGTRVEIKNLNSFRFVEKAIQYEIDRQIQVLENGGTIQQETRLYDSDKQETRTMRSKENANDYRYFADPDLCPVVLNADFIESIRQKLPELPDEKTQRFQDAYELSAYDANLLTSSRELADYFERITQQNIPAKLAANWVMGELSAALNKDNLNISESPLSAERLAGLLKRIADNTISSKIAKDIFPALWAASKKTADDIIQEQGLRQVTDQTAIAKIIDEVLAAHPQQLSDYRAGRDKLYGFFVGQVMKASGGKLNPQQLNTLLKQKLDQ